MLKFSGCKKMLAAVAAVSLGVLASSNARAGFTTVNAPWKGEDSQAQILSHAYGGNFQANGLDFTNGTVTAVRQDDTTNASFHFDISSIKTISTFSGWSQGLAYGDVNNPTQLFNVTGKGYNAVGETGFIDMPSSFSLVRTGKGGNWSSDATQNADGADHLVSYLITGTKAKGPTYVMFWEDGTKGHGDFDFNDLAVQISAGSAVTVPLPAGVWSGLATLAGGLAVTGYRKARRQQIA